MSINPTCKYKPGFVNPKAIKRVKTRKSVLSMINRIHRRVTNLEKGLVLTDNDQLYYLDIETMMIGRVGPAGA